MTFDLSDAYEAIESIITTSANVEAGWEKLLDYCNRLHASPCWAEWRTVNIEPDLKALAKWMDALFLKESPPSSVKGLWFGLFESTQPPAYCMYISGSDEFDPKDKTAEWAANKDWEPENRYFFSKILDHIFHKLHTIEKNVAEIGMYVLCLGYSSLAVKSMCRTHKALQVWLEQSGRGVAVGFDDGDAVLVA